MSIDLSRLTSFLQDLVRIRTLSGEEKPGVDRAAEEMRSLGFDHVQTDKYGNAIGVIKGAKRGPTILFDAHMDTVPVSPGSHWKYKPFGAEIDEGRIYGRGTADMKGALAAMIYAAAAVDRSTLEGRVVVSASVMEEVIEGFLLTEIVRMYQPDYVVIGEASDLNLVHAGRGRAEIQLEALGRPTHSSTPHLGENAIINMLRAIEAIEQLPERNDPLLGPATMGLTDIISDPYPGHSVIPSRCLATYDRRVLLGESDLAIIYRLKDLPGLESVGVTISQRKYTTYTGAEMNPFKFFPAWKLEPDDPYVEKALEGLRAAGLDPTLSTYRFNTNATYTAGIKRIPTVGFGPATEARAHMVDEYIEIEELEKAAQGYLGIINAVLKDTWKIDSKWGWGR